MTVHVLMVRWKRRIMLALIAFCLLVVGAMFREMYEFLYSQLFTRQDNEMKFKEWHDKHLRLSKELTLSGIQINKTLPFEGHRIVHLDLKGAPPRISYFKSLFPLLASAGTTGLLIEYEDMFPYSKNIAAKNAYNKKEIRNILEFAETNNLEVIPLVQMFGHLEFVLKLKEYKHLRENAFYTQAICPSRNGSLSILKQMIDDILELHPKARFIHIGCDEVYQLGECYDCSQIMNRHSWSTKDLFLHHVTSVARYISEKKPDIQILMWDDQLRTLERSELEKFALGKLVTPVIWYYNPDLDLPYHIWNKYAAVFSSVWVASSFKGATGPSQILPNNTYHVANNYAWMLLVQDFSNFLKFDGIILTGWQRYDHFAILCELLPPAIPSLINNLLLVSGELNINRTYPNDVQSVLYCGTNYVYSKYCNFPGVELYNYAVNFYNVKNEMDKVYSQSQTKGWITPYNIKHNFMSTRIGVDVSFKVEDLLVQLRTIQQALRNSLLEVYDEYTVTEWLETVVEPVMSKAQRMSSDLLSALNRTDWPRRPLK